MLVVSRTKVSKGISDCIFELELVLRVGKQNFGTHFRSTDIFSLTMWVLQREAITKWIYYNILFWVVMYAHDRTEAISLSFHDINYRVKEKLGVKRILDGISGYVPAGSFLAILGSSGAGKSLKSYYSHAVSWLSNLTFRFASRCTSRKK